MYETLTEKFPSWFSENPNNDIIVTLFGDQEGH